MSLWKLNETKFSQEGGDLLNSNRENSFLSFIILLYVFRKIFNLTIVQKDGHFGNSCPSPYEYKNLRAIYFAILTYLRTELSPS
jgi:hypothetical protein